MRKIVSIVFFLLLCTETFYASEFDVQQEINAAEEGAVLVIPAGRYEGNFAITKSITLTGEKGAELVGLGTEAVLRIEGAQAVTVEKLAFTTKGRAIVASDVEWLTLRLLKIEDVHNGIHIQRAKDVHLQQLSITGNDAHYAKKGNGIAISKSKDVVVEDSEIQQVQDGIYIEEVEHVTVNNNTVKNSRYGTHFMYTSNATVQKNAYLHNVTGLMIMMTEHLDVSHNELANHQGGNGYGMLLYDVQHTRLRNNTIINNRTGVALQKSTAILIEQNDFQMNQTAIEGTRVDEETRVTANRFTGNILTARSDNKGFRLVNNYYDDYSGLDLQGDGIGDTPYVAVSSFGQWMVRQPVYQYFIESPSVTLLTTLDTQINKSEKAVLVDAKPRVTIKPNEEKAQKIDTTQLLIGLLLSISSVWLWRRGMQ